MKVYGPTDPRRVGNCVGDDVAVGAVRAPVGVPELRAFLDETTAPPVRRTRAWRFRRLVLAACLAGAPCPTTLTAQGRVTVEPGAEGRWRLTYDLPAPTTQLRFSRTAAFFRETAWRVLTPGYQLRRDGDSQILEARPGATPRSIIELTTSTYTDNIPKEYEAFLGFTDGAVALYTGHLFATASSGPDTTTVFTVRILPPEGSHVIARGGVVEGPFTVADTTGDGTYVYVGTANAIETADQVSIVDPGLPAWLADQFREQIPRILATYRSRLGSPLPWKPLVFYSFVDSDASGYTSGGGTLPGVLAMSLEGKAWHTESQGAAVQAFRTLAHESAHLWNGQLVAGQDGGGSWMHEGAADALAGELLHDFGISDDARYRDTKERALNQCANAIREGPVETAAQRGVFQTFYDCGNIMALWTAQELRRRDPDADLFSFWSSLIAFAKLGDGSYDEDLYFRVLSRAGVPAPTVARMRAFVDEVVTPAQMFDGLRASGLYVEATNEPPPGVQRGLAWRAFSHLMEVACGRPDFRWGDPLVTAAVEGCEGFESELRISSVAGWRLHDQGAALYDDVVAACAKGGSITLTDDEGVSVGLVPCDQPLDPRPQWYRLR